MALRAHPFPFLHAIAILCNLHQCMFFPHETNHPQGLDELAEAVAGALQGWKSEETAMTSIDYFEYRRVDKTAKTLMNVDACFCNTLLRS